MNLNNKKRTLLTYLISLIWLINGFFCKILNLVPRHQQIIATITRTEHPRLFTIFIGISESLMSLWIISGKYHRLNAITQILIIATMNTLEFFLVPDLLLWGRMNALFALLLIGVIWYNEFRVSGSLNSKQELIRL